MSEPSIYEKAFAKTDKTDAILVIEGKKMHVNKALLSYHSDYFNTLFNSEFKEKSMEEIEIKDVDFENFATLLSLLQENQLNITTNRVVELLNLADRFLLKGPKRQIEQLIGLADFYTKHEKLEIADKYHLESLMEQILSLYNTPASFRELYSLKKWKSLSDATKLKISNRFFETYAFYLPSK